VVGKRGKDGRSGKPKIIFKCNLASKRDPRKATHREMDFLNLIRI
jgi:hypothetical protein